MDKAQLIYLIHLDKCVYKIYITFDLVFIFIDLKSIEIKHYFMHRLHIHCSFVTSNTNLNLYNYPK